MASPPPRGFSFSLLALEAAIRGVSKRELDDVTRERLGREAGKG